MIEPIYCTAEDGPIEVCPCGVTPSELCITDSGQGGKWMAVTPNCCGEWNIEFRTLYADGNQLKELAMSAWNEAPRGKK